MKGREQALRSALQNDDMAAARRTNNGAGAMGDTYAANTHAVMAHGHRR